MSKSELDSDSSSDSEQEFGTDSESKQELASNQADEHNLSTAPEKVKSHYTELDLPSVSIITPTYNRKNTIKLAVVNFLSFDYPKDKLEWVIIDDGTESILDILPEDPRIKYYYLGKDEKDKIFQSFKNKLTNSKNKNTKKIQTNPHLLNGGFLNNHLPLGLKRNLGVAYASHDYIVHMDDDDYYPKNSIKTRIFQMLENPKIQCLGCTQLNQFYTTKLTSIKTKASEKMNDSSRIYECTLMYTRKFWKQQHFNNSDIKHESANFFKNRYRQCKIIEPTEVIVSLIHRGNQELLKGYQDFQPNGWHFGTIPDELFLLITSL